MADGIVIRKGIGAGGWTVADFGDGEQRVGGMELGRRLQYNVANPTRFSRTKIGPLLESGKFNDFDIKSERISYRRGYGESERTEYWPTLKVALQIAMEVQTPAAKEIRQQVIESLEKLQRSCLPAPLEAPANDLVTGVDAALARTDEIVEQAARALSDKLVQPLIRSFEDAAELAYGYYIDQDRRRHLSYLARLLIKAEGKGNLRTHWRAIREAHDLPPGNLFATVPKAKFDIVESTLRQRLKDVRPEQPQEAEDLDNVVDHPSKVAIAGARPADPDIDMNPRRVALRLSADLGRPVLAKALTRAGGVYHCATIDPLYENTGRSRKKGEPYLDETRYRALLQFARTQTRWLDMILDDGRTGAGST